MNKYHDKAEDERFKAIMLKDISFFHHLYAKYRNPQWLELAKLLGEIGATLKKRTYE